MSKAGQRIIKSARQALAHTRGEKGAKATIHVPPALDAKAIRKRAKMTQEEFCAAYGFDLATLRNWEQGRRAPTGAARVLLLLISREPELVRKALEAA
jgi:putative transcriptional regulator